MEEPRSDFLTIRQRIKFIFFTLPILNTLVIFLVASLSDKPWLTASVGFLTPVFGYLCMDLIGRKLKKDEIFGNRLAVVCNGLVAGCFCAVSGPDAPSYLAGMALLAACIVLLTKLREVLFFISLGLLEITAGSLMAGREPIQIVIGLITLICYALVLIRFFQFTSKQGAEIIQQKAEIEEKNKNITDSINYALRIQQAKLPEKEKIAAALPQSFVLFKPKDIVSGDFYFFAENTETIYIAAADCTGHGVPGALMSMVGMERLEDTLAHYTSPSDILHHLNKGVKASLKQTEADESTRDGMDLVLCQVDREKRTVQYAGANRPLWILRKGQTAVEEIKATKKAIGGHTADNTQFAEHLVQLQQGDTFYLFSDGYADTFGGKTEKKLTTRKFKELLLTIQDKNMQQQGSHLDSFIESWKEGLEQVDDILVIGVRL